MSVLPCAAAVEAIDEVSHRLISATCLHLVKRCLPRATLLAGEEANRVFAIFNVIHTRPICPLRSHLLVLCLFLQRALLFAQKISGLHLDHLFALKLATQDFKLEIRVLHVQNVEQSSEFLGACLFESATFENCRF